MIFESGSKVAFASDGLNRLRIGLRQAGVDAGYFDWPPANDPNRPPYRGLRPLEADDDGLRAFVVMGGDRLIHRCLIGED